MKTKLSLETLLLNFILNKRTYVFVYFSFTFVFALLLSGFHQEKHMIKIDVNPSLIAPIGNKSLMSRSFGKMFFDEANYSEWMANQKDSNLAFDLISSFESDDRKQDLKALNLAVALAARKGKDNADKLVSLETQQDVLLSVLINTSDADVATKIREYLNFTNKRLTEQIVADIIKYIEFSNSICDAPQSHHPWKKNDQPALNPFEFDETVNETLVNMGCNRNLAWRFRQFLMFEFKGNDFFEIGSPHPPRLVSIPKIHVFLTTILLASFLGLVFTNVFLLAKANPSD